MSIHSTFLPEDPRLYKHMARTTKATAEKHEDDRAFLEGVDEGLADASAGRVTPYEKVRRWLLSWGSDKELPPPKCP